MRTHQPPDLSSTTSVTNRNSVLSSRFAETATSLNFSTALFPNIRTVIADAGHQSIKLARYLLRQEGWRLQIVRRRQRAFKITGLTWIVERSFAWLCRNRRLSKDYEYGVQSSETLIEIASTRLLLNRLART